MIKFRYFKTQGGWEPEKTASKNDQLIKCKKYQYQRIQGNPDRTTKQWSSLESTKELVRLVGA